MACYSLYASFKFPNNDPAEFCEVFRKIFSKEDGIDFDDPVSCFKFLTHGILEQNNNANLWMADFFERYDYSEFLEKVFGELLKATEPGSYIELYGDEEWFEMRKYDEEVETLHHENEEE